MTLCQIEEINKGGGYPKSCPTCGLGGKCVKGLPHPFAKPDQGPAVVDFAKIKIGDRVRLGGEFAVTHLHETGWLSIGLGGDFSNVMMPAEIIAAHLPAHKIQVGDRVSVRGTIEATVLGIRDQDVWVETTSGSCSSWKRHEVALIGDAL